MPNGRAIKIMIIRHAEKPDATTSGVAETGKPNKHDLTVQGWQRAGALVCLFGASGANAPAVGLARPNALYASGGGPEDGSNSERPVQTLLPVARRLGLTINTSLTKGQEDKLAKAIQTEPGIVLVAWQHEAINRIVGALPGHHPGLPPQWCSNRFDLVYVLDWNAATETYEFRQIPQNLLAGDSETPMANPSPGE